MVRIDELFEESVESPHASSWPRALVPTKARSLLMSGPCGVSETRVVDDIAINRNHYKSGEGSGEGSLKRMKIKFVSYAKCY